MAKVNVYVQANGRVKAQWRDPITRRQRAKMFATREEANEFAVLTEAEMIKGTYRDDTHGKTPLVKFVDDEYFPEKKLGIKAQAGYRRYWNVNLKPWLEQQRPGIQLRQVQPDTAIQWSMWAQDNFQPSTVKEAFVVWRSIMTYASETKGYIPANPISHLMKQVVPDLNPPREKAILNPQQIVALSNAIQPRYKALVLLLGIVGMRPGEAIGLRIGDLHLTEGFLMVRRSVVTVDGKMMDTGRTKTNKTRKVFLPEPLVSELIDHIGTFVQDPTDEDALVFSQERRKGFVHTSQLRLMVVEAGKKIGEKVTTYDLRHSATVNGIQGTGGDVKYISQMLGHSTTKMTQDVYNHLTDDSINSNLEKLAGMYQK